MPPLGSCVVSVATLLGTREKKPGKPKRTKRMKLLPAGCTLLDPCRSRVEPLISRPTEQGGKSPNQTTKITFSVCRDCCTTAAHDGKGQRRRLFSTPEARMGPTAFCMLLCTYSPMRAGAGSGVAPVFLSSAALHSTPETWAKQGAPGGSGRSLSPRSRLPSTTDGRSRRLVELGLSCVPCPGWPGYSDYWHILEEWTAPSST